MPKVVFGGREVLWMLARGGAIAALTSIGFIAFGVFHLNFGVGDASFHFGQELFDQVIDIGESVATMQICLALLTECWLLLLVHYGVPWPACQFLFPLLNATVNGAVAIRAFAGAEPGPEFILLLVGPALSAFLGASLQVYWWRATHREPGSLAPDFPSFWYATLLLAGAAFLGAASAWSPYRPELLRLLEYRSARWRDNAEPSQPLTVPDELG